MKPTKKTLLENEVIKFIQQVQHLYFVTVSDVTGHLFLLKSLGPNASNRSMKRKWHAKKHHAQKLVNGLLSKNVLRIENTALNSLSLT